MSSGGVRPGAGRKKGEPTEVIRVPAFLVSHVKGLISRYKDNPQLYREVFSMSHSEVLNAAYGHSVEQEPLIRSKFTKKPASKRKRGK